MVRLLHHPAALIFLCFALIGTPVTYRGGATDAHPHMFLEFLLDASAGSFVHHHGAQPAEPGHHDADGHSHEHEDGQTDASAGSHVDRFVPTLSAFVVGDLGQAAYLLPHHELLLNGDVATAFHSSVAAITGLTHPPDAPPPQ